MWVIRSRFAAAAGALLIAALIAVVVVSRVSPLTSNGSARSQSAASDTSSASPGGAGSAARGRAASGGATVGSTRPGSSPEGTTAGGSAGTAATGPGGGANPPGGTNPGYAFSPQPTGSGASPSTHFVSTDMTMAAGQQLIVSFNVASPGSVTLHAFPTGTGSYDTSSLRACLEFAGQAPCAPAPFPNPAYWTVSTSDVGQHSGYQVRIAPTLSSPPLVGIDVGWNGSHHLSLSGLSLAGGCSAASTGYGAGCGLRFKFTAAGHASISAGPGLLHLKVKDKARPADPPACDKKFSGSMPCDLLYAAEWTGYLYPETGQPTQPASMTIDWP